MAIFDASRSLEPSTSLLPVLDVFRTIDWREIREKLEELKFGLGIQSGSVGFRNLNLNL